MYFVAKIAAVNVIINPISAIIAFKKEVLFWSS
jgi:hypothetical protein